MPFSYRRRKLSAPHELQANSLRGRPNPDTPFRRPSYFFVALSLSATLAGAQLPTGFNYKVLIDGLDLVSSEVLPDGRVLAVEKHGRIHLIKPDGSKSIALNWESNTWSNFEAGMMQVLADPDFSSNGYLYVWYTKRNAVSGANPDHNWVDRFKMNGDVIDPASAFKLLDLGFRGPNYHHGGGLAVNPKDGMLYVNVGSRRETGCNCNQPGWAGDTRRVEGKVLRIRIPSGEIPADNPWYGQNTGDARANYYYGLRNPFTLAFHPTTGALWIADVQDSNGDDEMNLGGAPGTGYGYGGGSQGPMFRNRNTGQGNGAMIGILFYTGANFPPSYRDKVFVGQVRGWGSNLRLFTPGSTSSTTFGPFNLPSGSANEHNPIDIKMDRLGAIYVSTRFQTENVRWTKGRVIKVWYGQEPTFTPRKMASLEAAQRMRWSVRPGSLSVELLREGTQVLELFTLDGKSLSRREAFGRGRVELAVSGAQGAHLLRWSGGGVEAATLVVLP